MLLACSARLPCLLHSIPRVRQATCARSRISRCTASALILLSKDIFTMFTGIIERLGKIESLARSDDGARLTISFAVPQKNAPVPDFAHELAIGASIAVNGCCLTVVERDSKSFSADLSRETLERTSFGDTAAGRIVNLDLPLAVGARLGGHFVQGHVDGVGRVERMIPQGGNWWLAIRVPQNLRRYVAEKGSLAVDGVSLTVARW